MAENFLKDNTGCFFSSSRISCFGFSFEGPQIGKTCFLFFFPDEQNCKVVGILTKRTLKLFCLILSFAFSTAISS